MRARVGIIGAGPAGLFLAHLLDRAGIDSIVVERRSRAYVESRVRAGVLEHDTADLLDELGLGDRMHREGLIHEGLELRFDGAGHRIDLTALTGRHIIVYGQQEVVKDLIAARLAAGGSILFESPVTGLSGLDGDAPTIELADGGRIECDVIAGADGFHGISRATVTDPSTAARAGAAGTGSVTFERRYPYAWLGILAQAPTTSHELTYASHERGFALSSMRTPEIVRMYLQVPTETDLAQWPDDRIWDELAVRLGVPVTEGPIIERSVTPLRSVVTEPMRFGRLFLAGDAAHIVPPTGAKGMNLAVADVRVLAEALIAFFSKRDERLMDGYSARCLRRVWAVQHFSSWMTSTLHRGDEDAFARRLQLAQLSAVVQQPAMATWFAQNYVGLPFES